jgi:arabinose-5-phosphate isomerase
MTREARLLDRRAADIMTAQPVTVGPGTLAVEALNILEQRKITAVVVIDPAGRVQGVIQLHDLWRTQMF